MNINDQWQMVCVVFHKDLLLGLNYLHYNYINDICNTSSLLKFILFADDSYILFWSGSDLNELSRHMSNGRVTLSIWFAINKLPLMWQRQIYVVFSNHTKTLNVTLCIYIYIYIYTV